MTGAGLELPPIIVGAWQLSAGHHRTPKSRTEALDIFDALLELGVTAFDCADIYTGVEELLGAWLGRLRGTHGIDLAGRVRIHTKLVPDRSALGAVDRAYVERIVDRSLERLGVERLDLVQFAWWDYAEPGYVDAALWLAELVSAGKVGAVGVTNFDVTHLSELIEAGVPVRTNQLQYSAIDHRPAGHMAAFCQDRDIPMLCYGTLAGGFLTDRWLGRPDPVPAGTDHRALPTRSLTKYRLIVDELGGWDALQGLLRTLRAIADRHDASIAQVAVRYVLSRPGVSSAIVGLSTPERIADCVAAAGLSLDAEDLEAIAAHVDRAPGPSGPVFGLEREPGSKHAGIMKYDLNDGHPGDT